MQEKNRLLGRLWGAAVLAAVIPLSATAQGVIYTRITDGRSPGGVVNDMAYDSHQDTLYAVCMENGLFHTEYDGNWTDNSWTEHLAGRQCYGLDAYRLTVSGEIRDYVIVATEFDGVWRGYYKASAGTWTWEPRFSPNPITALPSGWHMAHWEDVCFYGNDNQDNFFATGFDVYTSLTNGFYRWNGSGWAPVSPAINISRFYRDNADNNGKTIYGMGESGIYKSDNTSYSGTWASAAGEFTTDQIGAVTGFYQDGNNVKYILAQYGASNTYKIYKQATPNQPPLASFDADDCGDEQIGSDYLYEAMGLVVKPYGGTYYKIWIGTQPYGLLYYDTQSSVWAQTATPNNAVISGSGARSMLRDPKDTGDDVHIFYGTWQAGMYYYNYANGSHTWHNLNSGLIGGTASPAGALVGGTSNAFLGPCYLHGVDKINDVTVTSPSFTAIGNQNSTVQDRANYGKVFNDAEECHESGPSNDVYFITARPYIKHIYPPNPNNDLSFGGLYKITMPGNECESVSGWDSDDQVADWKWDANRIVADPALHEIFVATGEVGTNSLPIDLGKHIIQRIYWNSGLRASNIITLDEQTYDVEEAAPLALDLYPHNTSNLHMVIFGLGNTWAWGVSSDNIGRIYGPIPTSYNSFAELATGLGTMNGVMDLAAVDRREGSEADDYVVFASTTKYVPNASAQVIPNAGQVLRIEVSQGTGYSAVNEIDPPSTDLYGFTSIEFFNYSGLRLMWLLGTMAYTGELSTRLWLGKIDNRDEVSSWRDYGLIQILAENYSVNMNPTTIYGLKNITGGLQIWLGASHPLTRAFRQHSHDLQGNTWHWISTNFRPCLDSLSQIMVTCDSLEEMRDQYHHRYAPNANPPVDSIYVWNPLMAYAIKTTGEDAFESFGDPIPPDTNIVFYPAPQDSAWIYNFIAYLPTDTFNVNECFLADSDTVIIVKQDDGHFWRPGDGPEFDMCPGEGYQVGVNDTMTFQYPASQGNSVDPPPNPKQFLPQIASLEPSHFQFIEKTGDFYPIYIEDILINGQPPQAGDEVAVFAANDLCAGAAVYEGSFPLEIAGWKDDPCTEAVDGYIPGDTLSFKLYDASAGVEVPLEMMAIAQSYPPANPYAFTRFEHGYYAQHNLQASFTLPGSYALLQNYPNPFNPATTIRYDLPFESIVKLEAFDLMGRKVITLVDGKQTAGFRAIHWNGRNAFGAELASGVYFYRLTADATQIYMGKKEHFTRSHKMVLVK